MEEAPERRVGGGGGGLFDVGGGGGDVVGVCWSEEEEDASGCEENVAPELLRERESADLSWLCRRARGGVGGLRRCGAGSGVLTGGEFSAAAGGSEDGAGSAASLGGTGSAGGDDGRSLLFFGPDDPRGRGGRGLCTSDGVRCGPVDLVPGDSKDGEKSENDTTCGARVMDFPCLCFGGGGFFFCGLRSPPIKVD